MTAMSAPRILVLFGLMLVPVACGGGEPVALADIPVFDGAAPTEEGAGGMTDIVIGAMESSIGNENMTSEIQTYTLPDGTTFADAIAFYEEQLADTDWERQMDLTQSEEYIGLAGWTRGSLANEQALLVGVLEDPIAGTPIMIIGLFSE